MPSIIDAFAELRDPRCRKCRYPGEEILFTAVRAVLCGVDDWETIVLWGRTQLMWLRRHLPYVNGMPCGDTFRRVFGGLSPVVLSYCQIWCLRGVARSSGERLLSRCAVGHR